MGSHGRILRGMVELFRVDVRSRLAATDWSQHHDSDVCQLSRGLRPTTVAHLRHISLAALGEHILRHLYEPRAAMDAKNWDGICALRWGCNHHRHCRHAKNSRVIPFRVEFL